MTFIGPFSTRLCKPKSRFLAVGPGGRGSVRVEVPVGAFKPQAGAGIWDLGPDFHVGIIGGARTVRTVTE